MKKLVGTFAVLLAAYAVGDTILRNNGSVLGPVLALDCALDGGLVCNRDAGNAVGGLRCAFATAGTPGCVSTGSQVLAGYKAINGPLWVDGGEFVNSSSIIDGGITAKLSVTASTFSSRLGFYFFNTRADAGITYLEGDDPAGSITSNATDVYVSPADAGGALVRLLTASDPAAGCAGAGNRTGLACMLGGDAGNFTWDAGQEVWMPAGSTRPVFTARHATAIMWMRLAATSGGCIEGDTGGQMCLSDTVGTNLRYHNNNGDNFFLLDSAQIRAQGPVNNTSDDGGIAFSSKSGQEWCTGTNHAGCFSYDAGTIKFDAGVWITGHLDVDFLGIATDGGVKVDVIQGVNNPYSQILMNGNGNELRLRYTGGASCMLAVNDTASRSSSACPFNIEYTGNNPVTGTLTAKNLGSLTAPTISAGGCTSPSIVVNSGTFGFLALIGTNCTAVQSITFSFPYAAPNGWICNCQHTGGVTRYLSQGSYTATTCAMNSYARTTGVIADLVASETELCTAVPF